MEHNFEANFFTLLELLDPASRLEIDGACERSSFRPNQVIYEQGAPSNSVYIVASGMVEALTHSPDGRMTHSIGFLKKGEFFGDLGVLTGQPRLGTIRTCEPTQVLQIEKLMFVRLLDKIPKLGAYFARNLARRLHQTQTTADTRLYSLDLGGNLLHFDLLAIFHAIMSMERSGELRLNNTSNDLIGSFFFREGRVEHARFAHLEGLEAVWEGFLESSAEGAFNFTIMDQPTLPFAEEHKLNVDSNDLLAHGAARRDAFLALPEPLRQMKGKLNRLGTELTWSDPNTQALAERIWELIAKRPQPLDSLWRRLSHSTSSYLDTVGVLVATGQAEVLVDEPAGDQPGEFAPAP